MNDLPDSHSLTIEVTGLELSALLAIAQELGLPSAEAAVSWAVVGAVQALITAAGEGEANRPTTIGDLFPDLEST